jgi:hypothetical protein
MGFHLICNDTQSFTTYAQVAFRVLFKSHSLVFAKARQGQRRDEQDLKRNPLTTPQDEEHKPTKRLPSKNCAGVEQSGKRCRNVQGLEVPLKTRQQL